MTYQINYSVKHIYDSRKAGISIKTVLRRNDLSVVLYAKVDPGAEFCLFARELGEELDIDIESGYQKNLSTLAGDLTAFGHYVELETLGLKFDSLVYFAEDYSLTRNLLGRQGWFQLIKFGLDDSESEIYISPQIEGI